MGIYMAPYYNTDFADRFDFYADLQAVALSAIAYFKTLDFSPPEMRDSETRNAFIKSALAVNHACAKCLLELEIVTNEYSTGENDKEREKSDREARENAREEYRKTMLRKTH